ncbi:MAG: hydrogenase iron-sulfur subunit [Deltaproteobacteria bacterium]|nr:hydrogenase iron-sulfur subunit [Deltaproteobacteria bacterium]
MERGSGATQSGEGPAVFEPVIVAFLCNWCACEGADAAGRARLELPANVRPVRLLCSGRVDPQHVLEAFACGADGVLILGCRPGECRYREGNLHAMKRVALLRRLLGPLGVETERLDLEWVAAGEGKRYAEVVTGMVESLRALGPLKPQSASTHTTAKAPDARTKVEL